jgi:hypothetical protein
MATASSAVYISWKASSNITSSGLSSLFDSPFIHNSFEGGAPMKRMLIIPFLIVVIFGCSETPHPVEPDLSQQSATGSADVTAMNSPVERPLKMSRSNLSLDPVIIRDQELACGGGEISGGEISGNTHLTHLGRASMHISIAWDIGDLLDPGEVQFDPEGPAGGPVARILGPDDYPYHFQFNPFTGECGEAVSATGQVELTAANGDRVFAEIVGGETHRLDFVTEGDGVESFALIDIDGGTGRFADATGSFTLHGIARFDPDAGMFVIDLVEILPGGSISY